jgi:hypothetical protein
MVFIMISPFMFTEEYQKKFYAAYHTVCEHIRIVTFRND